MSSTESRCSTVARYHRNIGLGPWTQVRYGERNGHKEVSGENVLKLRELQPEAVPHKNGNGSKSGVTTRADKKAA